MPILVLSLLQTETLLKFLNDVSLFRLDGELDAFNRSKTGKPTAVKDKDIYYYKF